MKKLTFRIGSIALMAMMLALASGCTKGARAARILQAGDKYFAQGKYDEAEVEYKNVRHYQPMNPGAIGQLGRLYLKEGRVMEAYAFLNKATELEPNSLPVQLAYGQVCAAFHNVTNANKIALRILSAQPTNEDALLLLVDTVGSTAQLERALSSIPGIQENPGYHLSQAMVDLRQQKTNEAAGELNLALAANPKSSQAYFAMADLDMIRKDPTNAAAALEKAADLAPMRSPIRMKYIEFLAQIGSFDKARKRAEEITKEAPDYIPCWVTLMNMAMNRRQYDDAAKYANTILSRDDKDYEAMIGLGTISLAKGEIERAILQFDRVEALYPKAPQVKYELGAAYLANRDKVKGVQNLNQALSLDPLYRPAILLLAQLDMRGGDAASAVAMLTRYLQRIPTDAQAVLLLAQAYQADQKPDMAVAVYQRMAQGMPKNPQLPMLMGMVLVSERKNAEARAAFEKALEMKPDYLPDAEQLIDLDLTEGRFKDAMALVQTQIAKNPKAAEPWELKAKIYVVETNMNEAEASLLKAIDLNPDLPNPYLLLAQVYVSSGKEQDALKKLTSLVGRTNDAPAYLQIGAIHEKLKDFAAARDAYEKVLTINPRSSPALNNLAYIYAVRLNNLERAYELAQKAREFLPYNANVADTLGWILYERGEYQRALALLEEASELSPSDAEIQFHLGMTHYMMDEESLARLALERAIASPVDYPNKEDATNRLAILDMDTSKAGAADLSSLEKELAKHSNDLVILNRLGTVQDHMGDFAKAAETYESALKQNPDAIPIMAKLARLYALKLNEPEKALSLASQAHKLAPDNPEVSAVLGHLEFKAGDYTWALSLLENAATQLPNQPETLYDLAWAYYGVGRVADARATMSKALQTGIVFSHSNDAKEFVNMVDALADPSKTQAAVPMAKKALETDPNYGPGLMVVAKADEASGDFKGARECYNKVLAVLPLFTPAGRELAILDAQHFPDDAAAYTFAEKARAAYPDDTELAKSLGILCYYQAKYPRSAEVLQETVDKNHKDGEAYYYLGMDLYQSKRNKESKQALEQALALKIPEQLASTARQTLAGMKKE